MCDSEEIWKPIPGYDGWYEVSDRGRVRSFKKQNDERRETPRILSDWKNKYGYSQVGLCLDGTRIYCTVHRLVMNAFNPHPNSGKLEINHLNGVRDDNRLSNLEWCTRRENVEHAIRSNEYDPAKGVEPPKSPRGSNNKRAKLDENQVCYIRAQYATSRISQANLADIWGCSQSVISKVVLNIKWKHAHLVCHYDYKDSDDD